MVDQMAHQLWYCQPDGGQWNVRVEKIWATHVGDKYLCVIRGKDLVSDCVVNTEGYRVVEGSTLFEEAQ